MPNLYISGFFGGEYLHRTCKETPHQLLSLHDAYIQSANKWFKAASECRDTRDMCVMFDSGAFTAWNKRMPDPDVRELVKLYKKGARYCEGKFRETYFISLDKIPGKPDVMPSAEEIADAIRVSDENHRILAAELGGRVIPVFHLGEPTSRLHEVVSLNPEYICLSPRFGLQEKFRRAWAQRTTQLIPNVATHGLATTSWESMVATNWRSVDSATWIMAGVYGTILIPDSGMIRRVAISEHSPTQRVWGQHTNTIPDGHIQRKIDEICHKLELTRKELSTRPGARGLFNTYTLARIAELPYTSPPVPQTLFEL